MQKWKPPGTSIVEDNPNGRYLVMYQEKRKSVSWTLRGHDKACFLVLQHAWEWYVENTGQERIHIHAHICTCIHIYRPLACTGQWPNKPAEIASDEAAMRYRCSWKDLKDMALWTVLTHDACGMVYFVLTYTYALELIANVSRSSSRIRRRHDMVYM